MDRKELINKLSNLYLLLGKKNSTKEFCNKGESYKDAVAEKRTKYKIPYSIKKPEYISAYNSRELRQFPNSASIQKDIEKAKEDFKKLISARRYFVYSALVAVVTFLLQIIGINIDVNFITDVSNMIFTVSVIAMIFFYLQKKGIIGNSISIEKINEKIADHNKTVQKFNEEYSERTSIIEKFDSQKKECLDVFNGYSFKYRIIHDEMQEMLEEARVLNEKLTEEIKEYDDIIISSSNYPRIPRIITLLQDGAADDIGSAVRIIIEEERRDKFEAEQAERAYAAEQEQRRFQERQLAETERHNREVERQNREAQAKQEQARRDEQSRADQAERNARRAGSAQCGHCANYPKCPSSVISANRGSCGSFRVRK